MLTTDRIQACIAALEDQRIPDLSDLGELVAAWHRLQAGEPFYTAIAAEGRIALAERNTALRNVAQRLDPDGRLGHWKVAGLIHGQIKKAVLDARLADAVRLGARRLGRRQLYEIIRHQTSGQRVVDLDHLGENRVIESQETPADAQPD